jgi:hypothetical protein
MRRDTRGNRFARSETGRLQRRHHRARTRWTEQRDDTRRVVREGDQLCLLLDLPCRVRRDVAVFALGSEADVQCRLNHVVV